jgi:uncharacterized repeat protein (TIGR01451 family)
VRRSRVAASLLVFALATAASAVAADWSQFEFSAEHTAFNPLETVLGASNVSNLTLAWTGQTAGAVESSPAVVQGIVYVGSEDGKLYAFPAECGSGGESCSPLWTGQTGGPIEGSPAVENGVVYIGSLDGKLYAFPADCGSGGASCSPVWTGQTGDAIFSSPTVANGVVYVGSMDRKLYAFPTDCGSGGVTCSPLWTGQTGFWVFSSPAVADGVVYVGSDDGKLYAFPADCGSGGASCSPLWTGQTGDRISSSPAVANGVVYVGSFDHKLYAFPTDCGSGGASCSPLWTGETRDSIATPPSVANGITYVGSRDSWLYAFPADCGSGGAPCSPLWTAFTGVVTFPAIANGVVYVGSLGGSLYAFPAECGSGGVSCTPLWTTAIVSPIDSSPAIADAHLFFGGRNGMLYAFALPGSVNSPPSADLSLSKTGAPDPATAGSPLTYTLTVLNNGPDTAQDVSLSDPLPAGVTFVSANASQGSCAGTATVTCQLGTLADGAPATVTIGVTPSNGGALTNTATVTASTSDPDQSNNTATAQTAVNAPPPNADLSLAKSDVPDPVVVGSQLTYTLTVHNNGPDAAQGVSLSDPLPAGVTFVSSTASQGSCSGTATVVCQLGTLSGGADATITIVVTPTATGLLTNTATVTATTQDSQPANNQATTQTTVNAAPASAPAHGVGSWKNHASCSRSRGNQEPLLDKTLALAEPSGISIGVLTLHGSVASPASAPDCVAAVNLLNQSTANTGANRGSDPIFRLAAQLLAARLNVITSALTCAAGASTIDDAQALLASLHFDGMTHDTASDAQLDQTVKLASSLESFNGGSLCAVAFRAQWWAAPSWLQQAQPKRGLQPIARN